ncbi:MAG: phosphoribosyltransferase [Bacteroidales bacterium]|nr:phosphoribosyltransferase [Bacteroidales bacterium]
MTVVTLNPILLAKACSQLSLRVKAESIDPSLIIGIREGGAEVARLMRNDFPEAAYCEVRLSRPSSQQKSQGLTQRLLRSMPVWLCNVLRIVESRVNEWRSKGKEPVRIGEIHLPDDVASLLKDLGEKATVLLVDDAIDTGATIRQARLQLLEQFPAITLRVAVITVTIPHPICDADFCLYHNRTLCRFPWSNDYRSNL